MTFWNPENVRSAMGGTWLARPEPDAVVTGLSTDTRTIRRGQIFLAIKGEKFDGHSMLAKAAAAGSPLAVIDSTEAAGRLPGAMGVLKVADSRRALLRLAASYRRTLERTRVIAVCGSNGKTTTVRILAAALGATMKGTASQKSFNNDIGVPLTILSASPSDQFLICEVGTNAPGEIATLAQVVQPDIAVITSIGREHLEKLGSLRGVAREEASVLESLQPGGAGFYSADSPELREVLPKNGMTLLSFGFHDSADVRVASVGQSIDGVRFALNDKAEFSMPILGRHNAANASAAIAVARRMGAADEGIARGLKSVRGEAMRLEVSRRGGVCIINDAYNANPDSMRASMETFDEIGAKAKRRVVVLGDMFELGEGAAEYHAEVVGLLGARPRIDVIVLVGQQMKAAASGLAGHRAKVVLVSDMGEKHATEVAGLLKNGDMVLVKASRRMRLERLLSAMPEPVGAA
jgi:UDP-N-acetylmuramoyl-tripeptide--D-alanyl-D-alanine ligase